MRRLRLVLEYDGTLYAGWQRQPAARSVQQTVEEALSTLLNAPTQIMGAGRTDAGVHALGQTAHLSTASELPAARILTGLNALLPADIVARDVADASEGFHARRDARLRVYTYAIVNRPRPSVLLRHYAYHVPEALDRGAMRAAAGVLVGRHDFAAFRVTGTPTATTLCTVTSLSIDEVDRGTILVTIAADRFLRQMVRLIVGALVRVGRGTLAAGAVAGLLDSRQNASAGPAAPPHGLYLMHVLYDGDPPPAQPPGAPWML
jgi:tRNA pseudouridine38-40 synthase